MNTEQGQGATCEEAIQRLEALLGTKDDLEEAWVKVHQKCSQRTMSRMMHVFMEVHVLEGGVGGLGWCRQSFSGR